MRLIIEAPNGKIYYGAPTDAIFLRETMIEDAEPTRCESPQQVAEIIAKWYENPDNINCPFTLMNKDGDVHIFPPEILKRCIPTVEAQPNILKKYVPESAFAHMKGIEVRDNRLYKSETGEHASPGFGYEPENETQKEEINNETDN